MSEASEGARLVFAERRQITGRAGERYANVEVTRIASLDAVVLRLQLSASDRDGALVNGLRWIDGMASDVAVGIGGAPFSRVTKQVGGSPGEIWVTTTLQWAFYAPDLATAVREAVRLADLAFKCAVSAARVKGAPE